MTLPIEVRRIFTDGGSHIEPPHDPNWDDFTSLRWHAAVANHDCPGLDVEVHQYDDDDYNIVTCYSSTSPFDFRRAWTFINGLATGYTAHERATTTACGADS